MSYNLFRLNQEGLPRLLEGIDSVQQWEEKRKRIYETWIDYIGGVPETVPVRFEVLEQTEQPDHFRQRIIYDTAYGDKVTAYLLIPFADFPTRLPDQRLPAIMALHPTHEMGKGCVALPEGKENRRYALELVSRGYVVLAPDALSAGERIYDGFDAFENGRFYEQHPQWTSVAKNIVDHMQGVDLLCSLPFVDADRIGAIGHSFGGYNAFFLAGVDKRIKSIVCSCGFSPLTGDLSPMNWGVRDWYTHLPKITADLGQGMIPFEFHEIAALAATTPFFNYSAQSDTIFPHWKSIGDGMKQLFELYQWLNAEERFQSVIGVKGHDFPPEIRLMSYHFLDRWLQNTGSPD